MSVNKSPDLVVGGERVRRFSFARLKTLLRTPQGIIGLVAVLAVVAIGILIIPGLLPAGGKPVPQAATKPQAPSRNVAPVKVEYTQMSNQDLTTKVNYLIGTKQYSEAEKLIKTQDNYQSDSVKLSLLRSVESAANDTSAVAQTTQQIDSLPDSGISTSQSPTIYENTGDQYANVGDKTNALTYYNKALAAYKARNEGSDPDSVVRVQAKIKGLQS